MKVNVVSNRKGSATLEASIILPVILLVLFSMLFLAMYIYQKLVVLDAVVYTAKQTAQTWDNSSKELETGSLMGSFQRDGLYWRLLQDFPGSDLVALKTEKALQPLTDQLQGGVLQLTQPAQMKVDYQNQVIERKVGVSVTQNVQLPFSWLEVLGTKIAAKAVANVAEPVEYIRTIELGEQYSANLRDYVTRFAQDQVIAQQKTKAYVSSRKYDDQEWYNNVYHTDPQCRYVKTIARNGNLKTFASVEAARQAGYRLCILCAEAQILH